MHNVYPRMILICEEGLFKTQVGSYPVTQRPPDPTGPFSLPRPVSTSFTAWFPSGDQPQVCHEDTTQG